MQNKPDFIVVGAQKAATTSLYNALRQHPDIDGPDHKETHYFSDTKLFAKGLERYCSLFPERKTEKTKLGEFTPNYLFDSHALTNIYNELGGDTKIVVVLRNPVDRFLSCYKHFSAVGKLFRGDVVNAEMREKLEPFFDNGWEGESRTLAEVVSGRDEHWKCEYYAGGRYALHINKAWDLFGRKNVRVVLFEDLVKKPNNNVKAIHEFLGVEPKHSKFRILNTSKKWAAYYDAEVEITPEIKKTLENYYRPYNNILKEMLKRKLTWNK